MKREHNETTLKLRELPQDDTSCEMFAVALGIDYVPNEYVFSVVNRYMTGSAPVIKPHVGMPCTHVGLNGKKYPGTVVAVSISRHKIVIQLDKVVSVGTEDTIVRDKDGIKISYTRCKGGSYRGLLLGKAEHLT